MKRLHRGWEPLDYSIHGKTFVSNRVFNAVTNLSDVVRDILFVTKTRIRKITFYNVILLIFHNLIYIDDFRLNVYRSYCVYSIISTLMAFRVVFEIWYQCSYFSIIRLWCTHINLTRFMEFLILFFWRCRHTVNVVKTRA